MSTKRAYAESSEQSEEITPFQTYEEVHLALQAARRGGHDDIARDTRRALLTSTCAMLPDAIRQAGVRLAVALCAHPEANARKVSQTLAAALPDAAPSLRCEIYGALQRLQELKDVHLDLADNVRKDLNAAQPHVRSAALSILGTGASRFLDDAHAGVRLAALRAVRRQQLQSGILPETLYAVCVGAASDDAELVRLAAVDLVWAIGSRYADMETGRLRLVDDAFVRCCDLVGDVSARVRVRAATMLGRFRGVNVQQLAQTFNKKAVTQRAPRGYKGRNRGLRGQATPVGDSDARDARLLDAGAAGAFVHALEDEQFEVRLAAIGSIVELSRESRDFTTRAVDFLVDMFNDSSDAVRVASMRALVALGKVAPLQVTAEQLAIVTAALDDASARVRQRLYEVASCLALPSVTALQTLAQALGRSVVRHVEDQQFVYAALRQLGNNNAHCIGMQLARALLNISEHYLSREPRVDDASYAGVVVLLMNSHRQLTALPDYVFAHLPYLRDKHPGSLPPDVIDLVPTRLPHVRQMLERPAADPHAATLVRADARAFVTANVETIGAQLAAEEVDSDRLQAAAKAIAAEPLAERRKLAIAQYADLAGLVLQARQLFADSDALLRTRAIDLAARIMRGAYACDARTVGLDPAARRALAHLRLFAHAAWLAAHELSAYDERVVRVMRDELHVRVGPKSTLQEGNFQSQLLQLIANFRPLSFVPRGQCQYATAEYLSQASRTLEASHRFPSRVRVHAKLRGVARRDRVRVRVTMPTQQAIVTMPRLDALRPCAPADWILDWPAPVELPLGAGEPARVLSVPALIHPADAPWSDAFVVAAKPVPMDYDIADYYQLAPEGVCVDLAPPQSTSISAVEFRPPPSVHTRG
ncbi:hypothetical protein IWW55_000470 [Coemansia sp. RSA 2706]|nr:hypothetical protein IWW55_000470 [Coemansia sp. RSA 2706]KAJ2368776.1 hypothetical protein H4S01_001399 [Coemansia sp. RSA 2610]KAJ2392822.1 hypothetical protein H4S02_000573 [Coemansia sp. RSA 2611]